jgi:hypothetical protein
MNENETLSMNATLQGAAIQLIRDIQAESVKKGHPKPSKSTIIQRLLCDEYKRRHPECKEC